MGKALTVPVPQSVTGGTPVRVPPNTYVLTLYLDVIGAASLTVQFQYSGDGVVWHNAGGTLTADGFRTVVDRAAFVRAQTTIYASGAARGTLVI